MRSDLHPADSHGADRDSLYARKTVELRDMARALNRLKEQIEHTEREALERGLLKAHSE